MSTELHSIKVRSCKTSSQAFAPGTWSNIHRHWNLYSKFCSQFSLSKLPLSANNVIPFLQLYSESVSCHSTVANTLSSIKTVSKIKGSIPSNQFLFDVNIFMSGLKRSLVMAVNQMSPVTPQLLLHLSKCVDFKSSFHVCMWAAMLFLFFTFFRKSNVLPMSASKFDPDCQITRGSISCSQNVMLVKVWWSKTIQYKQRELSIPICSIPGSILCPVQAFIRLSSMIPVSVNSPPFSYVNSSGACVPLTYSVFVRQFRQWLSEIGVVDVARYCTHSFRRGGATYAFKCGVSPTLIKAQGDWSSDCYLNYIKLGVVDRLATTAAMSRNIQKL